MIFRKEAIFQPSINKKYCVQPKGLNPKKLLSFKRGSGTKQTYRVYSKELLSVCDVLIAVSMHLQAWKLYVEL